MHKHIELKLAPFNQFPRITLIESLNDISESDVCDFKQDFPALINELSTVQSEPEWLEDNSIDFKVANNIAETMAAIPRDLRYSKD